MAEDKAEAAGGGKKKLIIILAVAGVLLVGGAVATTMLLMGGKDEEAKTAKHDGEDAGHDEEGDGEGDEEEVAEDEEGGHGEEGAGPVYVELAPPFVVNCVDEKKRTRYIKAEISVLAKSAAVEAKVTQHMPAIRNGIVLLLGRQTYEQLLTNEGKEKLRAEALAEVQSVVKKSAGKKTAKGVEDLFFSSLVMQ
jgi:flagellar FliL protein